jgi:hypothetical protein
MADYKQGIKREVAEVKFLIHDLRVQRFINEVIHFHVTLNTDLEIYDIDQVQALHDEDLQDLKKKAGSLRKALKDYQDAVKNFSPDQTVILTGRKYIETIKDICELILDPLWGRSYKVLKFLPEESRSVQSHSHYMNCVRWLSGVYSRIHHFLAEGENHHLEEDFDIAEELRDFTEHVVRGYVSEKGRHRIELQLERLDPAVLRGNRYRFRRMYFSLIMNAVDALAGRIVGVIKTSTLVEGERAVLRVVDTGCGMSEEKIRELLTDKETLDGELHSLGFVFVRQTIDEFGGRVSIESVPGTGTTVSVDLPHRVDVPLPPRPEDSERTYQLPGNHGVVPLERPRALSTGEDPSGAEEGDAPSAADRRHERCGHDIRTAYESSESQHPGSIFQIGVTPGDVIDFFTLKPYERWFDISHEDLSPTFYRASIRGRLEEDEHKRPVLTLKPPQDMQEYFEFRELPVPERGPDQFRQMVRDEYIRVARKLIETGLAPEMPTLVADLKKFFSDDAELLAEPEPFPLGSMAKRPLVVESAS